MECHTILRNESYTSILSPCLGRLTGSSNGCLAAYLVREGYFGADEIGITVEQRYEMNRPSLLRLRASQSADSIDVEVGGRVLPVLGGQLQ